MTFIEAFEYFAMDWHDWEESTEFITVDGNIDVSGYDVNELIAKNIAEKTEINLETISEAIKKLLDTGEEQELQTAYECSSAGDLMTVSICLTEKKNIRFRWNGEAECSTTYAVHTGDKSEYVYVPIREYLCFPKMAPVISRCFHAAFDTYEEAKAYMEHDMPDLRIEIDGHIGRANDIVVPMKKKDLETDIWYKDNIRCLEAGDIVATWSKDILPTALIQYKRMTGNDIPAAV